MSPRKGHRLRPIEIKEFHTPSSGIFFKARRRLLVEKTPYQVLEIVENDSFGRVLLLDGLVQTTERDEFFYHEMLVHPAMMTHPNPREVLIIGGGDGGALREVLRYRVQRAVLVEIDRRVVEACRKYFPLLASSFRDPRAEVRIEDGNGYIRQTRASFDVILVDSSDPLGPSAVLHQRRFYAGLKERLQPGGVIAGQAGSPLFHLDLLRRKRAFLKRFFRFSLYYCGPAPTYPGGLWSYAYLSDKIDPLRALKKKPPAGLKYYNADVHRGAFALPEFLNK
ncbi:MAG: polyamine aminopropyltransferase [Acidobacteriota bacterium]